MEGLSEVTSTPDVSVVIPTRNRWPRLVATLASVLSQEDVALEVLVVDDGSDAQPPGDLPGMDDPRVRLLRHETQRGQSTARNTGIAAATGRWIAFLDDDDLWAPRKLRKLLDAASERNAQIAYSGAVVVDEDLNPVDVMEAPPADRLVEVLLPANGVPAGASNMMVAADLIRRAGGFDEELSQFSDWDMWLRVASEGRAAMCPEPLIAYVQHTQSILVVEGSRDLSREWGRLVERHSDLSRRHGIAPDRAGLSRWMAWGHLRSGRRVRAALLYLDAARRNPPYGRRGSLEDAVRALLGRGEWRESTPPADLPSLAWLARYRTAG